MKKIVSNFSRFILGLFGLYSLIGVNMFFGIKFYSIEFAFIGFIILAVFLYFFKIDSRFIILPAILFLGFIPFLLTLKQDTLAENLAIYVYYFLVVGVILQIIETSKEIKFKFDFSDIMFKLYKKVKWLSFFILFGIVAWVLFALNYFLKIDFSLLSILFGYLSGACFLIFLYSLIDN